MAPTTHAPPTITVYVVDPRSLADQLAESRAYQDALDTGLVECNPIILLAHFAVIGGEVFRAGRFAPIHTPSRRPLTEAEEAAPELVRLGSTHGYSLYKHPMDPSQAIEAHHEVGWYPTIVPLASETIAATTLHGQIWFIHLLRVHQDHPAWHNRDWEGPGLHRYWVLGRQRPTVEEITQFAREHMFPGATLKGIVHSDAQGQLDEAAPIQLC